MFDNLTFDTIYHEHVFYYSLLSVTYLFKKVDLEIYDVEFIPMQGGSLRIFVAHLNVYKISPHATRLIRKEREEGFDKIEVYKKIGENVKELKEAIVDLLTKFKREGKTIAAYGTPAKGNVLLNYFGISKYLDFIVDKSPSKQGLYTPGTHMLVYPPSKIWDKKPDYLFLLSWNIADEVISEFVAYTKQGGKFIIPIPKLLIL